MCHAGGSCMICASRPAALPVLPGSVLMDKAPHGLAVVSLGPAQHHTVARPADHLQVVAGEPFSEGLHVAGDSGLTHTQQLAVIVELSRLPVPEQFEEQVSASLFSSCRFGAAVFDDLLAELLDILQFPGQDDSFSLPVDELQAVMPDIVLQKAEFPLDGPLADPQPVRDLLF